MSEETKTQFSQIEEVFNIAEKISQSDIQEYKDARLEAIALKDEETLSPEEFNAKSMYEAFKETHQVFKESLKLSKQMLSKIHENLMVFDEELSPEMVAAYASLQKNITDSLKTISQSYKLLTEAKSNLEPKVPKQGNTNIENANIIMTHGVNTHKLLDKFRS